MRKSPGWTSPERANQLGTVLKTGSRRDDSFAKSQVAEWQGIRDKT